MTGSYQRSACPGEHQRCTVSEGVVDTGGLETAEPLMRVEIYLDVFRCQHRPRVSQCKDFLNRLLQPLRILFSRMSLSCGCLQWGQMNK